MHEVRAHLFIFGDVIGVGFRYWMKSNARKLGLTGWVKNLTDCVEVVMEGKKDKVSEMITLCGDGSPTSRVKDIDVEWREYSGEYKDFQII